MPLMRAALRRPRRPDGLAPARAERAYLRMGIVATFDRTAFIRLDSRIRKPGPSAHACSSPRNPLSPPTDPTRQDLRSLVSSHPHVVSVSLLAILRRRQLDTPLRHVRFSNDASPQARSLADLIGVLARHADLQIRVGVDVGDRDSLSVNVSRACSHDMPTTSTSSSTTRPSSLCARTPTTSLKRFTRVRWRDSHLYLCRRRAF